MSKTDCIEFQDAMDKHNQITKLRRKVRDALNKTCNVKKIIKCGQILEVIEGE